MNYSICPDFGQHSDYSCFKAGFYIKPEIGWQVTISSYVVIHNEFSRFALADFRECKLSPLVQILHPINNTMGTLQKCQVSSDRPGID